MMKLSPTKTLSRITKKNDIAPKAAFTLVEVVISTVLFTFLALSVSRLTMMSFRTAHINVYKTTAESVAQGYMEQIKSLDQEALLRMTSHQASLPLRSGDVLATRSVTHMASGANADQIDDWLVANVLDPDTLSDDFEVINHKQVLVDIDAETGEQRLMDMWIDVEIHRVTGVPGNVFLIDLQYIFSVPGLQGEELTLNAYTRRGSRDYVIEPHTIRYRENVNEGRMQLMTAALNFQTLE